MQTPKFKIGDRVIVQRIIPQKQDYYLYDPFAVSESMWKFTDKFLQHRDYWSEREVTVIAPYGNTPSLRMEWAVMVADKEGERAIFYHEELERIS